MSRDNNRRDNGDMDDALEQMRRALERGEEIPGFDRLLQLLYATEEITANAAATSRTQEDESEDDAMLAVMISEAMNGVDIARRYPRFFRRMLVDAELRAAFLDGLKALEEGRLPAADVLPRPPSRDLSFLKRAPVARTAAKIQEENAYLARWTRAGRDLVNLLNFALRSSHDLFTLGEPAPLYRSADDSLQDAAATLLQGRVSGNNVEVNITLEGVRNAEQPDELQLTLWVLSAKEEFQPPADLALVAHVDWGDYHQEVEISAEGSYALPPRKIEALGDDDGDISDDLHITIHHKR